MRVLHIPFTYFPDVVGGTEIFVAQLAGALVAEGISSVVAAPGARAARYEHEGVPVHRYALGPVVDAAELYNAAPAPSAREVGASLIAEVKPDVLNLHGYTRGIPLELAAAARAQGVPVVITYHTPSVTCQRGTLMLYGERPCDGALFVDRCSSCVLRLHGLPGVAADLLARNPKAIGSFVGSLAPRAGGIATGLRMTELMERRHSRVDAHLRGAAAIVAVSSWVAAVLDHVGVPRELVSVIPHGIADTPRQRQRRSPSDPVRLAFAGRLHPTKGIDIALDALRRIPSAALELHLFALREDGEVAEYARNVTADAERDPRVRLREALAPADVVATLSGFDALLVPSRLRETGPLVVLEAFAAGIPVIAASSGAIPERVRDGVDGLLFPSGDSAALAGILERFARDGSLRNALTRAVKPPRTIREVARETAALYERVVGSRRRQSDQSAVV